MPMSAPPDHEMPDWPAARNLTDLGELTTEWLTGARSWSPTYVGRPDPETSLVMIDALVQVNRAGWVTGSSQPGLDAPDCRQRAYVDGLVEPWLGHYAETMAVGTDLVVVHIRRSGGGDDVSALSSIAVTTRDGSPFTWLGRWDPPAADPLLTAPLSDEAVQQVLAADVLQVFDPVWGRDDVLWPWLHRLATDLADGTAEAWIVEQTHGH